MSANPADPHDAVAAYEARLDQLLRDPAALAAEGSLDGPMSGLDRDGVAWLGREVRRQLAQRRSLGQGTLRQRFAIVFAAHAATHVDDPDGEELMASFCASPHGASWAEIPGQYAAQCLEDAFSQFAASLELVAPGDLAVATYRAVIRALAVSPEPGFALPDYVSGRPGRWLILDDGPPPRMYAAVGGRILEGPLPQSALRLLRGGEPGPDEGAILDKLVLMGLVDA